MFESNEEKYLNKWKKFCGSLQRVSCINLVALKSAEGPDFNRAMAVLDLSPCFWQTFQVCKFLANRIEYTQNKPEEAKTISRSENPEDLRFGESRAKLLRKEGNFLNRDRDKPADKVPIFSPDEYKRLIKDLNFLQKEISNAKKIF